MRDSSRDAVLAQDPRPTNGIELSYFMEYGSRLAYCLSHGTDSRFDLLSSPATGFSYLPGSFSVHLHNDCFQILSSDKDRPVTFPYTAPSIPILESLEDGIVTRELLSILRDRLELEVWEEGRILCRLTDYRLTERREWVRLLRISEEVVTQFLQKRQKQIGPLMPPRLDAERKLLSQTYPTIATDPSPDVARFQSLIDWREKLWRRRATIRPSDLVVQPPAAVSLEPVGNLSRSPLAEGVAVPEAISHVLEVPV
jgi:hypothetical protein